MSEALFHKYVLYSILQYQETKLSTTIADMSVDQILKADETQLVDYLFEEYKIEPIKLDLSNVTIDQKEANIDVSNDPMRSFRYDYGPHYIKGIEISYFIPFTGDKTLFNCRPSTSSSNYPYAIVKEDSVVINIKTLDYNADNIKNQYNSQLRILEQYIGWINSDIFPFNNSLRSKISSFISQRKSKLLKDHKLVNDLGFPLRSRNNLPDTYRTPVVRKKIASPPPILTKYANVPAEPELELSDYENILSIISNMSLVMEKSPATFVKLSEEEIRDHFLMHLNGHYEGTATGETFNYEGKTDILIKDKGKNIFIAECKFWNGSKKLLETIDQLLGYVSWRDTKTAILLFNKNKDFSNVLNQIPGIVKTHSKYNRELNDKKETSFRYKFKNKDDENRELFLTILAFNIPK